MIAIERVTPQTLEREAQEHHIELPIEQTAVWADYQAGITDRKPWGSLLIRNDGELVAVISLIDMKTHGYHYLRSVHGPAWVSKPSAALERQVVKALVDYVRQHDKEIVFLRIDTWSDAGTYPVLSTVPYNETVVLDLTGGDDAIMQRMKRRGRRDVRKALRESPAEIADETQQAAQDFTPYYQVMVDTARRDGFTPAPMSDYSDMLKALGPDHCHVYAARIDGKVVAWSMVTIHDTTAVYYYASMLSEVRRQRVPDKLLYTVACSLGADGLTKLDLMGIGNDFAPSLKGLNEFKTKFTEETVSLAAGRDIPIKTTFYRMLRLMQSARHGLKNLKDKKNAKSNTKSQPQRPKAATVTAQQSKKTEQSAKNAQQKTAEKQ